MALLREGESIRDTYEVERFLGEGAFAEVYRVKHRFLGRQAMKVFKTSGMTIQETEELLGEALLLSRIGHPNIVRVFDANTLQNERGAFGFFTMEYVAGGSLEQFWHSHGRRLVPVDTVVDVISQVCRGLAVAHDEKPPIIHRDVKPQNILVGYDASGLRVRISDFGLAKQVNPLTLLASAQGTRCFKAPETLRDFHTDSCAGDVWAVGCTLYLLLTDRLPYTTGGDTDFTDERRFAKPLVSPRRFNIEVDQRLEAIVGRAIALRAEERYPNATKVLDDLTNWRSAARASEKTVASSQASPADTKGALGTPLMSPDEGVARSMATNAVELSHHAGKLGEAADLLEEAFNRWPALRPQYQDRVTLWRRGIAM
jgi:serine/threonine-protein kinase